MAARSSRTLRASARSLVAAGGALAIAGAATGAEPTADPVRLSEPREERLVRQHHSVVRRAAALPADALDLVVWPIRRAVIWAEQVEIMERIYDVLFFDADHTSGWSPNIEIGGEISGYGLQVFDNDAWGGGERLRLGFLLDGTEIEEQRVEALVDLPDIAESGFAFRADVFYQEDEEEDFYASPRSEVSSEYELDIVRVRVEVARRLGEGLLVGGALVPVRAEAEPSEGSDRPIADSVAGVDELAVLLGGGLFVELDRRDSWFRPKRGLFARVDGGFFGALAGEGPDGERFEWAQYRAEVQWFQPVLGDDRSIVVRALLDRAERTGSGSTVPFWWQPRLDEDRGLRGFSRNRFRDDGALLVNLEYRWPVWDTWDAYVFLDEGQVFGNWSDVGLERFEWSAGGGLLMARVNGFLARIEIATSDEDTIFGVGFKQAF